MCPRKYSSAEAEERLKEVTDQLESGVSKVFQSGKFENYLRTMSKLHHYSFGNVLLIMLQCPGASHVAGYNKWKKDFGRQVKRGEKGIKILAPCSFSAMLEMEKLDPVTRQPVLDKNGNPKIERVPVGANRFKVVSVFDVSQTEGKELPEIASELTASVEHYEKITGKLKKLSPYPIQFDNLPRGAKGCCDHAGNQITIQPGMSEAQTLKTMIHEITHAKFHTEIQGDGFFGDTPPKVRRTREVEAESVAYVVCQHFGVDTSEYSFGYIADWSQGKDLEELKSSLNRIRNAAAELIEGIEGPQQERTAERPRPAQHNHQPVQRKRQQIVR